MARNREPARQVLKCTSAAVKLTPRERGQIVNRARKAGAKKGCSIPLVWILAILAAVVCWLIYVVNTPPQPSPITQPPILGGLVLGSFLLPTIYTATRKWVYRSYYRKPVIIGA